MWWRHCRLLSSIGPCQLLARAGALVTALLQELLFILCNPPITASPLGDPSQSSWGKLVPPSSLFFNIWVQRPFGAVAK